MCVDLFTVNSTSVHFADVDNMAIDWLTGNRYFIDRVADKIFACNQEGDTCVTVLHLDLQNPKGMALDPLMG